MNILVTGSGRSGSWIIRGEQLGRAMGASRLSDRVTYTPAGLRMRLRAAAAVP